MIFLDSWAPYGQGFNTFQKEMDVDLALLQTNTKPLLSLAIFQKNTKAILEMYNSS